jgi:hypothetical protein
METTFTLESPVNIGTLAKPVSVSALQVTSLAIATRPAIAAIGTGTLAITLTDPSSGAQELVEYSDATVLELWAAIGDAVSQAVFAKLQADGKLPAGTVATK